MAKTRTVGQQAAMASWMAPILVAMGNNLIASSGNRSAPMYMGFVSVALIAFGIILAAFALARVSKEGRKGILIPAIVGLVLNSVIFSFYV